MPTHKKKQNIAEGNCLLHEHKYRNIDKCEQKVVNDVAEGTCSLREQNRTFLVGPFSCETSIRMKSPKTKMI